ncbi:hypothetical protein QQF45_11790 [Halopseudomonas aestusnigri]|jgi:hypothetical protein|uniref:hypothetical protein n=1 Tax=Halopseudomonas TaxID=2901189 RepID=UPI000C3BFE21|nr:MULTISPECIES: hypothetical protein [Halopseudomonas]MAD27904.1 hypothetical protein [Pseudomonadales bacterium]MEE2799455.1 hypothetical protein [Pseudomonadota bacterium]MAH01248.1 hypothetical protein [Pseudomonadales bacterium]MCC4259664.1 hypothetical protein [Halopseudomonas aestusnigri]MCK5531296.1 hypothetical protein [Halopseudomonas aestusnigri]|tara:strand:+ start:2335 stop:2607 length:273 start_codon:yes stop_codon:yes gene_type:complete
MKRAQLIAEIEQLDHQLALRIDIVHLSGALVQHQLGRIPPALLVGSGALAGALSQRLGAGRSRSLGMLGVRLLPMAESLLRMVRQLWSPL